MIINPKPTYYPFPSITGHYLSFNPHISNIINDRAKQLLLPVIIDTFLRILDGRIVSTEVSFLASPFSREGYRGPILVDNRFIIVAPGTNNYGSHGAAP